MFFCASSMTDSRFWMPPRVSAVFAALVDRLSPMPLAQGIKPFGQGLLQLGLASSVC